MRWQEGMLVILCWLFSPLSGFCADTTSAQQPEFDIIRIEQTSPIQPDYPEYSVHVRDSLVLLTFDTAHVHELDTISVRAKRLAGKDAAVKPTVVKGAAIRESSRSTPLEELSQESGCIYITSKGTGLHGVASGASGGIYIRGLGGSPNSQVLVVEDGAPDYQGIFGHPIPDAFFPSLIDRVTVIKGGDGVLYGTNALGGVIIVENRWLDTTGLSFENDAAYGSFNTFRERLTLLFKGKKVDIVSAFSDLVTDGHRDGTDGNSVAGQVGLRLHLPGQGTIIMRDKLLRLQGADPGVDFRPYTGHRYDVIRNNFSARFDKVRNGMNISITPWLTIGEHRLYDGFLSRDLTSGATLELAGLVGNSSLHYRAGVAGEYVHGRVFARDPFVTELFVQASKSADIYGQITAKPGLHVTVVSGGRIHYNNLYGTIPLYKLGLTWDPNGVLSIHTRLTKNFREPTLRELYLPFPVQNNKLLPETAFNWDAGGDFRVGKLSLGGTLFRTWASNMIKYFGQWPSAEVINIDNMEIVGVEGQLAVNTIGPFDLFLTGSFQDVGRFTKQNPDAKVNGRVTHRLESRAGILKTAINGEWVHDIYMNNYAQIDEKIPDVFFLDGSLRYSTHVKGVIALELYCIVRNLLNSRYEYIKYYRMPGINILAGITLKV